MANARIQVEVVFAESHRAIIKCYDLDRCATVADALQRAADDPEFAGLDMLGSSVGVYGKPARLEQPLAHGDRIEIYRPLGVDAKLARRARAAEQRKSR